MIRKITSRDNAVYKFIRSLQKPAVSRREKLMLVEGFRLCEEALKSGLQVVYVLFTEQVSAEDNWYRIEPWWSGLQENAECLQLSSEMFAGIGTTQHPQGFALVCRSPEIEKPLDGVQRDGLYMVLEGVQDPGNVGSIIRSADAFGFAGILLLTGCAWPFYNKALRASMGSAFHLPIYLFTDINEACEWLSAADAVILAADLRGEPITERTDVHRPMAVIIGNEGAGLSDAARGCAHRMIRIPMPGRAESLNAAAAASIVAYELMRHEISDFAAIESGGGNRLEKND